jgi:hypothetical protein
MAVMAFDHGAAAEIWRHAAFKVHYPLRLIMKLARLVLPNVCASGLGARNRNRALQWLTINSDPTENAIP